MLKISYLSVFEYTYKRYKYSINPIYQFYGKRVLKKTIESVAGAPVLF